MKILYSLIYCYEHDIIEEAVRPIMDSGHSVTLKIDLLSSNVEDFLKCKSLTDEYSGILELRRENNQSARHNDALIYGYDICDYDAVIFGEPGVHFDSPEDFNFFVSQAEKSMNERFMVGNRTKVKEGWPKDPTFMAFCLVTKNGWKNVGCWDENLFFSTNENDWIMRATRLSGNSLDWLEDVYTNSHHIGKDFCIKEGAHAALTTSEGARQAMLHHNFIKNSYLTKKWGALFNTPECWLDPNIFEYPFDNSEIGYYISPQARMNPYPQYARPDRKSAWARIFDKN